MTTKNVPTKSGWQNDEQRRRGSNAKNIRISQAVNYCFNASGEMEFYGVPRHAKWDKVRREHLENNRSCLVCDIKLGLDVHHIIPYWQRPDLELDLKNLVTLCGPPWNHHFWWGHLGSWKSYNLRIERDAEWFKRRVESRP